MKNMNRWVKPVSVARCCWRSGWPHPVDPDVFRYVMTVKLNTDVVIVCNIGPHHTDELDELKAHSNNHRVLEVIDRTDNLIIPSEKSFNETCLIRGGPGRRYGDKLKVVCSYWLLTLKAFRFFCLVHVSWSLRCLLSLLENLYVAPK